MREIDIQSCVSSYCIIGATLFRVLLNEYSFIPLDLFYLMPSIFEAGSGMPQNFPFSVSKVLSIKAAFFGFAGGDSVK